MFLVYFSSVLIFFNSKLIAKTCKINVILGAVLINQYLCNPIQSEKVLKRKGNLISLSKARKEKNSTKLAYYRIPQLYF